MFRFVSYGKLPFVLKNYYYLHYIKTINHIVRLYASTKRIKMASCNTNLQWHD